VWVVRSRRENIRQSSVWVVLCTCGWTRLGIRGPVWQLYRDLVAAALPPAHAPSASPMAGGQHGQGAEAVQGRQRLHRAPERQVAAAKVAQELLPRAGAGGLSRWVSGRVGGRGGWRGRGGWVGSLSHRRSWTGSKAGLANKPHMLWLASVVPKNAGGQLAK